MNTVSENTSITTLEKDVVLNDEATVRGQTAGAQSTSPLFNEESKSQPDPVNPEDEVPEYITGIRLHLVLFGITAVMFLVMLDMTIVVTVSHPSQHGRPMLILRRRFLVSRMISIRSKTLDGMEQRTYSARKLQEYP